MSSDRQKVMTMGASHFVHDIYTAFIPALMFLFREKFSLSYFEVTLITVACRIPCLFNPLLGLISNRMVLRYMITLTPFLTSLFIGLLGLTSSYSLVLLLSLLAGFSAQLFHVPTPALVKKASLNKVGAGMSIFMMGGELARTLGPFIITWFLLVSSFESMYKLSIVGLCCSFILLLLFKKDDKIFDHPVRSYKFRESWLSFFEKKDLFYILAGATLVKSFTASVLIALIVILLKESGCSAFLSGNSLSIIAFAGFIGVGLTGRLSDKYGKRRILLFLSFFAPLSLIFFLEMTGIFIPISLFLFGLVACSSTPVVMAYVQERCPEIPSFSNGIYMTFNFLVTSLIVLIIGMISDIMGIRLALYVSASFSLIGFFIIFFKTSSRE